MRPHELAEALERAARRLGAEDGIDVRLERPQNLAHGDLATNLAMRLSGRIGRPPRDIAQALLDELDLPSLHIDRAEIAGPGFINFRFSTDFLLEGLRRIAAQDRDYGRQTWGAGRTVIVEFVSANPTGPLHVGHGRGAVVGDAVARLLEWTGHKVYREFYVNDTGGQIEKFVDSVEARYRQRSGAEAAIPADGYQGDYVSELARELEAGYADRLSGDWGEEERALVREYALERIRQEQEADLQAFRVEFDEFRAESQLHRSGGIKGTLDSFAERGLLYESEGAVWLRTTALDDDKDRVLVKSDGSYTYFLPDIAYHRDKAERGFERAINVWGADHHGYVPRMQAALEALGLGRDFLEVLIVQLVRVERAGEEVKFSKRAGEFVTLRDLIDEAGTDVTRYFFLERRPQQQMVFDLDLALERSEKNPLYKAQYAHARIRSIYRRGDIDPTALDPDVDLSPIDRPAELEIVKTLLEFPDLVEAAARSREPHRVTAYLEGLASQVNSWYHGGNRDRSLRVLEVGEPLESARLALARGSEVVLRNALGVLGLDAPNRM